MLERQRIILDLVRSAPQPPTRTHIMKWLFLLAQEASPVTSSAFYDFVPYKYGPFSFLAYREMSSLESDGFLAAKELRIPNKAWEEVESELSKLRKRQHTAIVKILESYGALPREDLLEEVYSRYPWYASRSELRSVKRSKDSRTAVYTVGYQGRTIDSFLDVLLRNGIRMLIDVRKNAYSRKYGFIGKTLERLCKDIGLEYTHVPDLGVPSRFREDLTSEKAYEKLFRMYEKDVIARQDAALVRVSKLVEETPSALMCFEADPSFCHRGRLAIHISKRTRLPVEHLQ